MKVVLGSDLEYPHCHPSRDGWPTQAASKVLQPGYKKYLRSRYAEIYSIKSISRKLFNHKGFRAECSVGSDYRRRGIIRKETAAVWPKGHATPSPQLLNAQKYAIVQVSWLPQESDSTQTGKEI